jgi:hypothetical protein
MLSTTRLGDVRRRPGILHSKIAAGLVQLKSALLFDIGRTEPAETEA